MTYYFSLDIEDSLYSDIFTNKEKTLFEGYTYKAFVDVETPSDIRKQWEIFNKRAWDIRPNSHTMYIFYNNQLVSNLYVTSSDDVGTYHSARTSESHRNKGFYKYFIFRGLEILMKREVKRISIETGQKYLWPFWYRLGFKRIDDIHKIAKSFR